jgi:hypothetical protein
MHAKISLTGAQVIGAKQALAKVVELSLPFDLAYMVVHNIPVIEEECRVIDIARVEIIKSVLGDREINEKVGLTEADPEWKPFVDKFTKYLTKKVELTVELVDPNFLPETFTISPVLLSGLNPFFKQGHTRGHGA